MGGGGNEIHAPCACDENLYFSYSVVYISEKNMSGCLSKNIISLFSVARSNS
jgi:hypothetical protein